MGKRLGTLVLCAWVASVAAGSLAYAGDPTLIAWWKLNDGTGAVALDSSGNGNNGTIMNPAQGLGAGGSVWVNDPERGMVISFNGADGSGAYVKTDVIVPAQTLQSAFTWIFWAKQPAAQATNNDVILGNRYGGVSSPLQFCKFTPTRFENYNDDGSYLNGVNYNSIPSDVWVHHALVKDGASLTYYRNGVATLTNTATKTMAANPFYMGADGFSGAQENWQGYLSDVRLYERALTESEVKRVMGGAGPNAELAAEPTPANEATDVPRDAALGWAAGEYAVTHNVYLGTTFEDVNGASAVDPRGVLVGEGQADVVFDPEGLLEFGQTYYWRIDEVNAAPDNTVFKGEVWSFTAEPYSYPLTAAQITATASNFQTGMGPENTINGSGLDEFDQHDAELPNMWMTTGGLPAWVQYEFDEVYKLDKMWVWNSNQVIESFLGFGAKTVTVEYSADGETWATLEGATEFARAAATAGYAANTTVEFAGAMAKFVKITIAANWGGMAAQTGLSEVRFFYVPAQAFQPDPADGASGVSVAANLGWRPGRGSASHTVYIGTDSEAVAAGTVAGAVADGHNFTPDDLEFATTYFWKVDEAGDAGAYPGNVWSFTTQEFVSVDDFESYNDDVEAETTIWNTWIDGVTNGASGSQVGYDESPFAETTLVHGGKQSMPLIYDNSKTPYYSEAERTFDSPQDFAGNGAESLRVYYRGLSPAFEETASGTILMNGVGADIWNTADQFRFAYKNLSGNGSMVARVNSLYNSNAWAKAGVMIRATTDAGSVFAFMALTPGGAGGGNGASFQRRLTTGVTPGNTDSTVLISTPYWVKLDRTGDKFSAYVSPDGVAWTQLGESITVTMPGAALIGLALCSHDAAIVTGAEFSDVATTGGVSGAWQIAEIGATQVAGNSAEPLYITATDSSGKSKTVVTSDAFASARTGWQEWTIPYSEFTSAGVKMTAVKSLVIGVGNRAGPTAGGTGKVYIDDIGYGVPLP